MRIPNFSLNDREFKNPDKSSTEPVKLEENPLTPANGTDSYLDSDAKPEPKILLQPETRPISHD